MRAPGGRARLDGGLDGDAWRSRIDSVVYEKPELSVRWGDATIGRRCGTIAPNLACASASRHLEIAVPASDRLRRDWPTNVAPRSRAQVRSTALSVRRVNPRVPRPERRRASRPEPVSEAARRTRTAPARPRLRDSLGSQPLRNSLFGGAVPATDFERRPERRPRELACPHPRSASRTIRIDIHRSCSSACGPRSFASRETPHVRASRSQVWDPPAWDSIGHPLGGSKRKEKENGAPATLERGSRLSGYGCHEPIPRERDHAQAGAAGLRSERLEQTPADGREIP